MEQSGLYDLESMCSGQHSGALAALRLLRSYNHFVVPPGEYSLTDDQTNFSPSFKELL